MLGHEAGSIITSLISDLGGDAGGEDLQAALSDKSFPGSAGTYNFNENRTACRSYALLQYVDTSHVEDAGTVSQDGEWQDF